MESIVDTPEVANYGPSSSMRSPEEGG
jgi:hypothetical protein